MVFEPDTSDTDLLQDVPLREAAIQLPLPTLTCTLLNPVSSLAIPLNVMVLLVNICPFVGEVIVRVGEVISVTVGA